MSDVIDWSKAPEGATHYLPSCKEYFASWIKRNGQYLMAIIDDGEDTKWGAAGEYSAKRDLLIARPQPTPWSGEGLPPVGLRVEAAIPHATGPNCERSFIWIEGSVIAYHEIKGKTYAWFAEDDGFYPPNVLEFRPIRTPEQIAADEREAAILVLIKDAGKDVATASFEQARRIYDAGWRKQ